MQKKDESIIKTLESFGLSRKEAEVYFALLELGRSTVSVISRNAGINRTTGYDILNSLESMGLVRISGKEPKQEYVAESPDSLIALLNKHLQETQRNLVEASAFVPKLKSMHKAEERPHVKFYEGEEGLKKVYEDTLTSTEPIRAYASVEDMHEGLKGYFPRYYERRAGKGISIRAILPDNAAGKERALHDHEEARESALVSHEEYGFHPEINIYDNKVMIASWREKLGIIIESGEISDAMKRIFELAWAQAKRLDQEAHGIP